MNDDPRPNRDELPLDVERQIDRLSDAFEAAWKTGHAPRVEDYLDRVPAVGRLRLLEELLVVEFDLRCQANELVDVESYHQRFPGKEAVIDAALALHKRRRQGDLPRTVPRVKAAAADEEEQPDPEKIGRFTIRRRLGRGGFGVVYLAHDPGLDRLVALKVPRAEFLRTDRQRELFLQEARTTAKLKHAGLVTVYEVQQEGDLIYIVQEYIDGQNLAVWVAAEPRSWEDIARHMIEITTAIGYVHQQGFYHRDLKPGNILLDNAGHAHVADFGLAVHEDALRMLKGKAAGTPQYMSPEQVRGETHWIDDRTDIWALGVILYELLSGHRPFTATSRPELYEEIQGRDPKSPRTKNPEIPKELERICFKCLAKRRTLRYANASDLLEDLQAFLKTCVAPDAAGVINRTVAPIAGTNTGAAGGAGSTVGPEADGTPHPSTPPPDSGPQPPLRIVPKGLRSFDKEDKDFFLELLPGPRDREGLPDSIRFWKTRIEEMDTDATFPVGVMYGPSGCGKSSLVKAGLLPHLAPHVLSIFVEATPSDTELRLLKQLRKHTSRIAAEASLTEALAQLREGGVTDGQKVLLVLDQFEQWLHATANMDSSQLVRALRQCDGATVQCLILVRDDFWMSTTRCMQAMEIPQVEGVNSAAVDLFDPTHARKVLRAYGFAYGRLPEHDLSDDEQRFLDRAVQDLMHDGKVICVQLSLFADMMKGRSWTPASLQEVGGTSGVGVAFLDETFTSKTAPPTHRLHAKAAQAVLKALLPGVGTDIKGQMQSAERLLEVSGYVNRSDDFRELLRILDAELRLITPTEPEEAQAGATGPTSAATERRFYQLTHDYLVPSLRDWLTRKQKETRRGRAEIRLAERTALWHDRPEYRHLPSAWEYLGIRLFTRRRHWTPVERTMMAKARRVHALKAGLGSLAVVVLASVAYLINARLEDRHASSLVVSLIAADTGNVEKYVDELQKYRTRANPYLMRVIDDPRSTAKATLHARLMLVQDDPAQVEPLFDRLRTAKPTELAVIVRFLKPCQPRLNERLWRVAEGGSESQRLCAAAALADYDPQNARWTTVASDVVAALVAVPPAESKQWIELLQPVASQLDAPLRMRYQDRSPTRDAERPVAAAALSSYLHDQPDKLAELVLLADNRREFLPLLEALRPHRDDFADKFGQLPSELPVAEAESDVKEGLWKTQANAAICLLELGDYNDFRASLKLSANPSLRSFVIDRAARLGAEILRLVEHLEKGGEGDASIRQALILALGEYDSGRMSQDLRRQLVATLDRVYCQDPDAAVHSAARWTLGAWGEKPTSRPADAEIATERDMKRRNWFTNSQGQTFIVINGPVEFVMGVKEFATGPRQVQLRHNFAVASHEVTVKQFRQFRPDAPRTADVALDDDCPINWVSWYDAAEYCNWLSKKEGVREQEWCYEPNSDGKYGDGMSIPADSLQRTGYRLPTEAEWEYVCRADTTTCFSFGEPLELLRKYAWYSDNSQYRLSPVGRLRPNAFGAFDMHGNIDEWCHDTGDAITADGAERVRAETQRQLRGGYFLCDSQLIRFGGPRDARLPLVRDVMTGFRVAQTQR